VWFPGSHQDVGGGNLHTGLSDGALQWMIERIAIGAGTDHQVCRGGYLYAFANDAWGFYSNNRGSVRLTITRTA